ncbi:MULTISPECIES: DUF3142 domain-containing protein [unclassified Pseudomonas]|uniref:DUF3142 domain-containing protein n=1 Tax=unclassified Pseudomonas TaxID=196821 RepID=UPI0024483F64|nr:MULTISPECIES: DUF3142 domain-containing protein [unclassified Pseudomonas]MDG9922226.1 DUF3142 domain-containing protein [Pseudomonas sp. GD04045]MDH0033681.1 DUF3142 domain-containing protein [Pseudomonas sp. GD04019]
MLDHLYRPVIALLLASLLGCAEESAAPLDQQLYIWQRQWRPVHAEALAQSRADFSSLRVLALQAHPQAGWSRARVDLQLLRRDDRPLIAVVRLDGQLAQLDSAEIGRQIAALLHDWRSAGLRLQGLELDHDCATARLPAYAELLRELRRQLPDDLRLSITALPAWLDSPALDEVLAAVDSSVLQVHAVRDPQHGLFDPEQAQDWAERYGERSAKPFHLALPAYGVALTENGQVESETPLRQGGPRRELRAEPQQVSELLADLRNAPPSHLAGIIWFRLPLAGDRRAWPLPTLLAVVRGQPLVPALALQRQQRDGFSQLQLFNNGTLASPLPQRIELPARACAAADAVGDYRLERSAAGLAFVRQRDGRLEAGEHRALGWARCERIDQGGMHVQF